jgi:hypothetical protein
MKTHTFKSTLSRVSTPSLVVLGCVAFSSLATAGPSCLSFGTQTSPISTREFETVAIRIAAQNAPQQFPLHVDSVSRVNNTVTLKVAGYTSGGDCLPAVADQQITYQFLAPASGTYALRVIASVDQGNAPTLTVNVESAAARIRAYSFITQETKRYFLTASETDVALLESVNVARGYAGSAWQYFARSDDGFFAWSSTGAAPSSAKPVCRFYHPMVSTHFYSADATECDLLRRTAPWVDEGIAFRALLPQNGSCPDGTDIVYRLFSAELANHRYTRERDTIIAMSTNGWKNEGPAFCSPKS